MLRRGAAWQGGPRTFLDAMSERDRGVPRRSFGLWAWQCHSCAYAYRYGFEEGKLSNEDWGDTSDGAGADDEASADTPVSDLVQAIIQSTKHWHLSGRQAGQEPRSDIIVEDVEESSAGSSLVAAGNLRSVLIHGPFDESEKETILVPPAEDGREFGVQQLWDVEADALHL